jgi:hypothetical protein
LDAQRAEHWAADSVVRSAELKVARWEGLLVEQMAAQMAANSAAETAALKAALME